MSRSDQSNGNVAPRETAKDVVVEFSRSPATFQWAESTPSHETETKSTDNVVHVRVIVGAEFRPQPPSRIANRYNVIGELGTGGQASVYLAEDTTLGRKVAIKMPRAEQPLSQQQQEQFQQEARAIAALKHPGIVSVHDFGIHDDGRCYIVLEYLSGQSLNDCLKRTDARQSFNIERTIGLISRVAEALHYAHHRGIYHRDLKPGNILLDEHGNPRITDFGLAVTQESQRGLKGQVAGTAPYMAPEQVRGEAHWLNGQADIWALGVIFYEMLAGRRPFQGGTQDEVKDEILHRTPSPLQQVDDKIPRELEQVVMKCLEKDVGKRYGSGNEFAAQLAAVRLPGRIAKPVSRSRLWIGGAAAVALLILMVGLAYLTIFVERPGPKKLISGVWNDLLDRPPEPLAWQEGREKAGWHWDPKEQRVSLESKKLGLLKLVDVPYPNFDLECQVRQVRWTSNVSIGIFFGYQDETVQGLECKSIQVFVISSVSTGGNSSFSLDRRRTYWPRGEEEKTSNQTFADARIAPRDMEWLPMLFRVRKGQISEVLVNNKPAKNLTSADAREMEQRIIESGQPTTLDCRGPLGLYIDGRGRGASGEFRFVRIKPNP